MPKFLIEVPHAQEAVACAQEVHVLLSTGSHFLSLADWGCVDGVHCSWLIIEADSKEDARMVVPPLFRSRARIVGLNRFSVEQIEAVLDKQKS